MKTLTLNFSTPEYRWEEEEGKHVGGSGKNRSFINNVGLGRQGIIKFKKTVNLCMPHPESLD